MSPYLSRLAPEEYVEGRRRVLYSKIFEEPGICYTELQEKTGVRFGVLQYHLETLERAGFVESVKVGRFRRYYPVGLDHSWAFELHAHAKDPGYSKYLRAIDWIPGATNSELQYLFPDVTRQSIAYRLKRLSQAGALESERDESKIRYFLTGEASSIMDGVNRSGQDQGHCGP